MDPDKLTDRTTEGPTDRTNERPTDEPTDETTDGTTNGPSEGTRNSPPDISRKVVHHWYLGYCLLPLTLPQFVGGANWCWLLSAPMCPHVVSPMCPYMEGANSFHFFHPKPTLASCQPPCLNTVPTKTICIQIRYDDEQLSDSWFKIDNMSQGPTNNSPEHLKLPAPSPTFPHQFHVWGSQTKAKMMKWIWTKHYPLLSSPLTIRSSRSRGSSRSSSSE